MLGGWQCCACVRRRQHMQWPEPRLHESGPLERSRMYGFPFKLCRRLGALGEHSMTIAPVSCNLQESGCKSTAAMLAAAALNIFQQSSMPGSLGWGTVLFRRKALGACGSLRVAPPLGCNHTFYSSPPHSTPRSTQPFKQTAVCPLAAFLDAGHAAQVCRPTGDGISRRKPCCSAMRAWGVSVHPLLAAVLWVC